jgi:hypothetical protein
MHTGKSKSSRMLRGTAQSPAQEGRRKLLKRRRAISQRGRELIEKAFAASRTADGLHQSMVRGLRKVDQAFVNDTARISNFVRS